MCAAIYTDELCAGAIIINSRGKKQRNTTLHLQSNDTVENMERCLFYACLAAVIITVFSSGTKLLKLFYVENFFEFDNYIYVMDRNIAFQS